MTIDSTHPIVLLEAPTEEVQTGVFDVTVKFSESVTGFEQSELSVEGSNASGTITTWAPQTGGTDYIATITPTHTGTSTAPGQLFISVASFVAQDANENFNENSANATLRVDIKPPTVTISNVPSRPQSGSFTVYIDFGEPVTGFVVDDINIIGKMVDATATISGSVDGRYTATITPTEESMFGTLDIQVPAGVAQNAGGHPNKESIKYVVTIDRVKPMVELYAPKKPQNKPFDVTITFSEEVTGFSASDFSLMKEGDFGGTVHTIGSGKDYILKVDMSGRCKFTITVKANGAYDNANNGNVASDPVTVDIDTEAPTAAISGVPTETQTDNFNVTITFSEEVTDFDASDITFTNESGTARASAALSGSGTTYTATIRPRGGGNIGIQVPDNVAQDAATNGNQASAKETVTVGDVVRLDVHLLVPSGVQTGPFVVSVAFTDPVTGFEQSELNISGTAGIDVTDWSAQSDRQIFTAWIRPTSDGAAIFNVAANVAQDDYDNWNFAAPDARVTVDLPTIIDPVRPSVSINVPSGTQTGQFSVTVQFSERVNGFTQNDLSVTGTAGAPITSWDSFPDLTNYTAAITPSSDGTAIFNVAADVAHDAANNGNTAAVQQTVAVDLPEPPQPPDTVRPSVTINVPSGVQTSAFNVTVEFSEPVTGFVQSELSVTGSSGAAIANWTPRTSGRLYVAHITPSTDGDAVFNVVENAAQDGADNWNTAAPQKSVTVDLTAPTVTITGLPTTVQAEAFDVAITFSEDVTGFVADDIELTGSADATSTLTGSGAVYTAHITPSGEGMLEIQVPAGGAHDAAGHPSEASSRHTVQVDAVAPTVTIDVPSTVQSGEFDVKVEFSEPVTGFVQSEFYVAGSSDATVTNWVPLTGGSDYIARITPSLDGIAVFNISENVAQDGADNWNTVATQKTVTVNLPLTVTEDRPGVNISVPAGVQTGTFFVLVAFTEPVTGFVQSEFSVSGSSGSTITNWVSRPGGSDYIARVTPSSDGSAVFHVAASVAQNSADNWNTTAT